MNTLTEPAPVRIDEHATDPILPAVKADSPERCGVEDCGKAAEPFTYCRACHMPLCMSLAELVLVARGEATMCPMHEGGE